MTSEPSTSDDGIEVRYAPEQHRYEVWADGRWAGLTAYVPRGGAWEFTHTEIDPAFEGRGLGSVLVRGALDDLQARGIGLLPVCPFVLRFVQRHQDYAELVPPGDRERFALST